ncbi:MAG TPA: hypothetical protein VMP08_22505 [Anaerolineae bacterium]|nr:hypothetical protein [Anaerolineae bacterium]
MTRLVLVAPVFHGQLGPLDELQLCLTPIAIVVALVAARIISRRSARKTDRGMRRRSKNG